MSAIVKNRGRTNLPISTTALWLVLGLAAIFFLVNYGQELLLANQLAARSEAQRLVNTRLNDENTRLSAMLQYYKSDKYIEQRAREDLSLRRSDEEVLIPVGATPLPAQQARPPVVSSESAQPAAAGAIGGAEPTWLKWLDLFQPPR